MSTPQHKFLVAPLPQRHFIIVCEWHTGLMQ